MTIKSSLLPIAVAAFASALPQVAVADDHAYLRHDLGTRWEADTSVTAITTAEPVQAWWRTFEDPLLDSLITIGEANNYDVSMAARRIDMARAAVRQAQSAYYPQIGIDAGWTRERTSGRTASRSGSASTLSWFSGGATMSWEIDVFGKIHAQASKAKSAVKVSAAEYNGAILALDAEIATTYIGLLVNRAQLDVATEHSANQKHILDITETRYRTGLVSKLDVAQANTLYYSTIAQIPLLEASIEADYNSLAVLLGVTREELPPSIYEARALPSHYQLAGLGTPLDVLRRRPDVVAAEKSIDVAAAELGIAKKDYLPSLSISANVGTQAHAFGDLFTGPSFTYSVAPTLSWTLFDGFARRAATASARENMQIEIENYNLTVLTAIEEVRNALARYSATLKYIERTAKVVESSEEAVNLSLDQYKQGLSDFYNVVEAQLNYLTYQNSLVAARGEALTSLIDLYKALGGGF